MAAGENALSVAEQQRQVIIEQLQTWVCEQLREQGIAHHQAVVKDWAPLGGDAGFRRYFRLQIKQQPGTLLAVWAPPVTEKNHEFVAYAQFFKRHGVTTPEVLAFDEVQGFLLLQDLGTAPLLEYLSPDSADALYTRVCNDVLLALQLSPKDSKLFPEYNQAELRRELNLFGEWFVAKLLDYVLSDDEHVLLERCYQQLEFSALQQPRVVVHRDFHSRNLMYRGADALGVIDFQDAVLGPLTYDLVSLLRDCYISWPAERVERWCLRYFNLAKSHGLIAATTDASEFKRWFDWMGLQRHIKVLGIFARLWLRDGKQAYLHDLPLVVHYVKSVAADYSELSEFSDWFDSALWPLIQAQAWISND